MNTQVEITVEPAPSDQPDSQLRRFSWYLGSETTTEAALLILQKSAITNCFAVYKDPDNENFTISIKITPYESETEVVQHLQISRSPSGEYSIFGQNFSSKELPELIQQYIHTFLPPLLPAVGTNIANLSSDGHLTTNAKSLSTQNSGSSIVSTSDDNKVLLCQSYINSSCPRVGSRQPQWHHYEDRHRHHFKNLCFGCCYRRKDWNGIEYSSKYSWYDLRGNGPLRLLCLLLFWLSCGLCFGSYRGLRYVIVFLVHIFCPCCFDYEE